MPAGTLMNSSPMDRSEIVTLVRERLAEILEIEASTINEGDSFSDDLEADSLALIELVEAIEEELSERTVGFRIDDENRIINRVQDALHILAVFVHLPAALEGGVTQLTVPPDGGQAGKEDASQ